MKNLLFIAILFACTPLRAESTLVYSEIVVTPEQMAQRTLRPADTSALEAALVSEVLHASNRQRALAGLSALDLDPTLSTYAKRYSERMRDESFFGHVAPNGDTLEQRLPRDTLANYQSLGENLWRAQGALDWRASPIAEMIAANWIDSPTHRENLLTPSYTVGGVGIAVRGDALYVTMLYARPNTGGNVLNYILLGDQDSAVQ